VIIITHYQRILHHIQPDKVHVLVDGRIVKSGSHELAKEIEQQGYEKIEVAHG
jgi:Fe-S cluster assembly ATP-binding protein